MYPTKRKRSWSQRGVEWAARSVGRMRLFLSDPLRRFQLSLAFLLIFLLMGVLGYMLIEGFDAMDALYMTVITVTTVGYGDFVPSNDLSRVFTVVLIVLGIGAATTAVSNAADIIVGQRLWGAVRERRMGEYLKVIENHYIVAGYGRIGRQLVRDILLRGEQCVIIDRDPSLQTDEYLLEADVPYLIADATEDAVLERAGMMRARGFVAALPSDADNVLAVLTARGVKEDLFIVARASDISSESKLRRAGADHVISPYQVGAHRMAMALMRPAVHQFMSQLSDIGDADSDIHDIGQIDVREGMRLAGQTLLSCDLRRVRGLTILAIAGKNGELVINPSPNRVFEPGDALIVIGPSASIYSLEEMYEAPDDGN